MGAPSSSEKEAGWETRLRCAGRARVRSGVQVGGGGTRKFDEIGWYIYIYKLLLVVGGVWVGDGDVCNAFLAMWLGKRLWGGCCVLSAD